MKTDTELSEYLKEERQKDRIGLLRFVGVWILCGLMMGLAEIIPPLRRLAREMERDNESKWA